MTLDVYAVSALVDEFMDHLVGVRIQDVLDVGPLAIGLEVYAQRQRRYLLLDADPQSPKVYLAPHKLRRGIDQPTQVGLLARRYLEGGVIQHVAQVSWERIIEIEVEGPEGPILLVAELMPRRSNILLVRAGTIMDCIRRVGRDNNRVRTSLPGHAYTLPPAQTDKRNPFQATEEEIQHLLAAAAPTESVFQCLVGAFYGTSPNLAKECVFQATGHALTLVADADSILIGGAWVSLMRALDAREWQPGVARRGNGTLVPSAFPLHHMDEWVAMDAMSQAIAGSTSDLPNSDAYERARLPIFAELERAIHKVDGKLVSLRAGLTDDTERERLRRSGELILAYQYQIQPDQTLLEAHYDPDEAPMQIRIDTQLSALENAKRYFDRYERAKRALAGVPERIQAAEMERSYLQHLQTDLMLAENWPDIDAVRTALARHANPAPATRKRPVQRQAGPLRLVHRDGFVVWVGRNSAQNETVTFKTAARDDVWLHARGVPGAHVVIRYDGRAIPEQVIAQSAAVAAHYSGFRGEPKAPVDVTLRKHVRSLPGAGPGMVSYTNERTLQVVPEVSDAFQPN